MSTPFSIRCVAKLWRRLWKVAFFIIPDFWSATVLAIAVVLIELSAISWIRHRYMDTPLLSATFQVMVGGALGFKAREFYDAPDAADATPEVTF